MTVQGITRSNLNALNELKVQSQNNAKEVLPGASKQLEGVFLQSMLKSKRMEQHFLAESSPFRCKDRETFQDILDVQHSNTIPNVPNIGLADMLAEPIGSNQPLIDLPSVPDNQSENNKHLATINDFVQSIWPKAKQAAALIGLDPKILIAQAALETGWGKFVARDVDGSTSNNLFNIKAGSHSKFDSVQINTSEYIDNTPFKINASFRKYSSVEESFNDYISLIKGSERYQNTLASVGNPELYVHELYKAGYATDPNYAKKILAIYHGEELNQAVRRCC